jgi:ATP-dependent metalloprotease
VTIGIENRSYTFPKKDLRDVAIHEVGHALAAYYTKGAGTLHKITILPRGPSLGHAKILENKDKTEKSLLEIMGTVDTMMGGRAAEFVVKGQDFVTLGCSSDLNYATNFVYAGIERGMFRDKLGVYVPKNFNEVSEQMRNQIDSVAMEILQESFKRVVGILQSKKKIIEVIADELLEVETMSANQVVSLIKSLE